MRAAGYIRVSQERAVRNGYGLDAQESDIHRFLEYRKWKLVELSGNATRKEAKPRKNVLDTVADLGTIVAK